MRELELDGIHDDGEHLLLVDSDGERYTLRIDKALRAAVRTDRPALNMIQAADAAPLRPREIQAMLRSGRSAEDIAEASEIPLEHVRRYEGPVLAEREWTAQRTRTFPVGRGGPALQDVVTERLAAREASGDTAWDAWRRQDGTWTLELTFSAGGRTRQAHWVADLDNRSVSPVDDEARWISDEDAPDEPRSGRGRLQSVKSSVYDLEADGSLEGAPTTRPRTWSRRPISDEHPSVIGEGDLEALNARRGLRSVPRPDDSATVWSDLDDTDDTETAALDIGAGASSSEDEDERADADRAAADRAAADRADAGGVDADREAEQEHTADALHGLADLSEEDGSGDVDDAASGLEGTTGHEDTTGLEDTDVEDHEHHGPEGATSEHGSPEDEEPGGAHGSGTSAAGIRYQDTVDLTPLPGFDDEVGTASPTSGSEAPKDASAPSTPAKKSSKQRSKRASMPSWDEIVFGSKHD